MVRKNSSSVNWSPNFNNAHNVALLKFESNAFSRQHSRLFKNITYIIIINF